MTGTSEENVKNSRTEDDCTCIPSCECVKCAEWKPVAPKVASSMACSDQKLEHPPGCDCLDCLCEPCGSIHETTNGGSKLHGPDCDCIQCLCDPCKDAESESIPKTSPSTEAIKEKDGASRTHNPDCDCIQCLCAPCGDAESELILKTSPSTEAIKEKDGASRTHHPDCDCIQCLCAPCGDAESELILKTSPSTEAIKEKDGASKPHDPDCDCIECLCAPCGDAESERIPKTSPSTEAIKKKDGASGPHDPDCDCIKCLCAPCGVTESECVVKGNCITAAMKAYREESCKEVVMKKSFINPEGCKCIVCRCCKYKQKQLSNIVNTAPRKFPPKICKCVECKCLTEGPSITVQQKPTVQYMPRSDPQEDTQIIKTSSSSPDTRCENQPPEIAETPPLNNNIELENQNDYAEPENVQDEVSEPVTETTPEDTTPENVKVQNDKPQETEEVILRNAIEAQNEASNSETKIVENQAVEETTNEETTNEETTNEETTNEETTNEETTNEETTNEETTNEEITEASPEIDAFDKQISEEQTSPNKNPTQEELPADNALLNEQVMEPVDTLQQDEPVEAADVTNAVQSEITELDLAINQIQCACYEAELLTVKNALPTRGIKKEPSFAETVSGLRLALSNLQSKCNEKDRVIAALANEIKSQASCEIMTELLQRIAEAYANPSQDEKKKISNCDCTPLNNKSNTSSKQNEEMKNKGSASLRTNREGSKHSVNYSSQNLTADDCDCAPPTNIDRASNNEGYKPAVNYRSQEKDAPVCKHSHFPKCPCVFIKRPKPQKDFESSAEKQNKTLLNQNRPQSRSGYKKVSCMCNYGLKKPLKSKTHAQKPKRSPQKCSCAIRNKSSTKQDKAHCSCKLSQPKACIKKSTESFESCSKPLSQKPTVASLPRICLCDPKTSTKFSNSKIAFSTDTCVDSSPLEIMEIRKVSSGSLLIKWKTANHKDVIGYEVLVDNIKKSKVRSRTRDAAVVNDLKVKDALNIEIYALTSLGRCMPSAKAIYQA